MKDIDPISDKFKSIEKSFRTNIPNDGFTIIRLDGKAFHTFTKQFEKPYDEFFMDSMDNTGIFIIKNVVNNALCAYVQSDEISIVIDNRNKVEQLFNGQVMKLTSITASAASLALSQELNNFKGLPLFDSRVFNVDTLEEVIEYLDWRRLDARKNAITMAASVYKSPKQLHKISTRERLEILKGTPHEKLPNGFFYGRFILPIIARENVSYMDKRTQEEKTVTVDRKRWISRPAVKKELDKFFSDQL